MSLRTGTELITLTLLLNKLSGIYGLLALLTGMHLSPLQFSMYIYSLLALLLTALLAPHVRRQSPLHTLALAWFYLFDSIINAAYTAAFSLTWFLVVASAHSASKNMPTTGGASAMDQAAGFTSPHYKVSHVDVVPTKPDAAAGGAGQNAVVVGSPTTTGTQPAHGGVFIPESATSLAIITALWLVRVYFILVVMAHARAVLRQHVRSVSHNQLNPYDASAKALDPFAAHTPEGEGWRGRLGRAMVSVGRSYWLGSGEEGGDEEDVSWARGLGGRFEKNRAGNSRSVEGGQAERERRRRAGTGPPPVPSGLETPKGPRT